jgi:hypothetical protein
MNTFILQEAVVRRFSDGEITYEQATFLLDAITNKYDYITEGANIDYIKQFRKTLKEYKMHVKILKKIANKGEFKDKPEFEKEKKAAIKALEEGLSIIKSTPSDIVSTILSYFAIGLIDAIQWTIPILLTFGLAAYVVAIKQTVEVITGIVTAVKKKDDEDITDNLNLFKTRYKMYINHFKKSIDAIEKKYFVKINGEEKK